MREMASRPGTPPLYTPEPSDQPSTRRSRLQVVACLVALMSGYALLFGWLSLARYESYQMHALDMGNMGQAAWNTLHGHPFFFTNMRLEYKIEAWHTLTRLSFHVEPLFPLISLVYLIYPHPESLLVLQTLALALGAIPVYLLARDHLHSPLLALALAAVYLLFPALEAMNLYEFHPVALATPLLLFAFWFAYRRRYVLFLLCCLAAMGTKEQIGLTVALFGLYVVFVNRDRRVGLAMAVVGVAWSLLAVLVIEHHFRLPGTLTYVRQRYGYFGHGIRGALHTVILDPALVAGTVFTWAKLGYVRSLLAPAGFVSLFAAPLLFLASPTLVLNLLSTDPHMYSGLGDNSAEIIAVVMIAAVFASRVVLRLLQRWISPRAAILTLAVFLLVAALVDQRVEGYAPFGGVFQVPTIGAHQRLADRFVAMVPASVPVSTQDQLDPHLSSRHYVYLFPDTGRGTVHNEPRLPGSNYILLDVSAPTYPLPSYQVRDAAQSFMQRPGWGVVAAQDGLILIAKGAHSHQVPSRFYSYAYANASTIPNRRSWQSSGLRILGYGVQRTDLPNHRVPNLAYSIYFRPTSRLRTNLQPVVFERDGQGRVECAQNVLGLAWLPTSRWTTHHTYIVRMDALETQSGTPGPAKLYMELAPVSQASDPCPTLWAKHGSLFSLGTRTISF